MAATFKPRLKDQFAYLNPDTRDVVVIQLWHGFVRSRATVVTIVNGHKTNMRAGTAVAMQKVFDVLGHPQAGFLPDDDARVHLADRGIYRRQCGVDDCLAVLPIGGLWCTVCGAVHGARQ